MSYPFKNVLPSFKYPYSSKHCYIITGWCSGYGCLTLLRMAYLLLSTNSSKHCNIITSGYSGYGCLTRLRMSYLLLITNILQSIVIPSQFRLQMSYPFENVLPSFKYQYSSKHCNIITGGYSGYGCLTLLRMSYLLLSTNILQSIVMTSHVDVQAMDVLSI